MSEIRTLPGSFFQKEELFGILQGLIQKPSENPNGTEEEAAKYVLGVLQNHGIGAELSWVAPGRPNVIARLKGEKAGSTLLYNGHLDVVPAGPNWSVDPFRGIIKDGKLFGRGASDMKSGVSAMLYAAIVLKRMGCPFAGELILYFNVDEEGPNSGMKKFLTEDITADFAVIGEPTQLNLCIGHRGVARYRVRTRGTPGHTAYVTEPDNAITKMTKFITALEELGAKIKRKKDSVLGPASLIVSQISGGTAPNVVPGWCEIEIDRRTLPGETREGVLQEIRACLDETARLHGIGYELEEYLFLPASLIDKDHAFVKRLMKSIRNVRKTESRIEAFGATCEAPFFSIEKQIPTLIFGPGSLEQAHVADEYVLLDEVVEASLVFIDLVLSLPPK